LKIKMLLLAGLLVAGTGSAGANNLLSPGISGITLGLTAQQQKDRLESVRGLEALKYHSCAKAPNRYPGATVCSLKVPNYKYFGAPVKEMTYWLVKDEVVNVQVEFEKASNWHETAANMTKVAKGLEQFISMPLTLRWVMPVKMDDGSLLVLSGNADNKSYMFWTAAEFRPKLVQYNASVSAKARDAAQGRAASTAGKSKEDLEAEEAIRHNYAVRRMYGANQVNHIITAN